MQICISSFFEYQLNESLQPIRLGCKRSIYSTADAVYIQPLMQYIFNC